MLKARGAIAARYREIPRNEAIYLPVSGRTKSLPHYGLGYFTAGRKWLRLVKTSFFRSIILCPPIRNRSLSRRQYRVG